MSLFGWISTSEIMKSYSEFEKTPHLERVKPEFPDGDWWLKNDDRRVLHLKDVERQLWEFRSTPPIQLGPDVRHWADGRWKDYRIRKYLKRAYRRDKIKGWLQFWKW